MNEFLKTREIFFTQFSTCYPVVLNRRPPGPHPAHWSPICSKLLLLHHVFWLGQHMYTGTCLNANETQTAGSLTAASNFLLSL